MRLGHQLQRMGWLALTAVIYLCLLQITPVDAQTQPTTHTVITGDTLSGIAVQYGSTVADISQLNQLENSNLIYIGQVLALPLAQPITQTDNPTAVPEPTLAPAPIATQPAPTAEPTATPAPVQTYYYVQAGDTLYSISRQLGVSQADLQAHNNLVNPDALEVGQALSIPTGSQLSATPQNQSGKRIVVDISEQWTYAYEDGVLVYDFISSSGRPGADTFLGTYQVNTKLPVANGYTWNITMPHWLGFYWAGSLENGFHGLPTQEDGSLLWDGYLGRPVSYGCIILSIEDAETLYEWADIGTVVVVQE